MAPVIRIDEQVMAELKKRAVAFNLVFDSPNSVLRVLFGLDSQPALRAESADYANPETFDKAKESMELATNLGQVPTAARPDDQGPKDASNDMDCGIAGNVPIRSIRPVGLRWFSRNAACPQASDLTHITVSKYYRPAESWTGSEVHWFDIAPDKYSRPMPDHIHLLCQKSPSSSDFFHLSVPNDAIADAVRSGSVKVTPKGVVRLHLSARPADRFVDIRGRGRIDFSRFLQ